MDSREVEYDKLDHSGKEESLREVPPYSIKKPRTNLDRRMEEQIGDQDEVQSQLGNKPNY
jgi:hypothetical protein